MSLHRVVPCLSKEYHTPEMVPFVLPNILLIAEEATKEEFQSLILQDMIPLFRLQEPIQVTTFLLQSLNHSVKLFHNVNSAKNRSPIIFNSSISCAYLLFLVFNRSAYGM